MPKVKTVVVLEIASDGPIHGEDGQFQPDGTVDAIKGLISGLSVGGHIVTHASYTHGHAVPVFATTEVHTETIHTAVTEVLGALNEFSELLKS